VSIQPTTHRLKDMKEVVRYVKGFLGLPPRAKLPRCPAKDQAKVKALRAKGDYSHSELNHVPCDLCRCTNPAGYGTTGDFYGIGIDSGHIGVGFCAKHEKKRDPKICKDVAQGSVRAMQSYANANLTAKEYRNLVQQEAGVATANQEMGEAMEFVRETLTKFQQMLQDEETMYEGSGKNGDPIPMSDKTRIELSCKLAKTVSDISKDKFTVNSNLFVHIDDIKAKLPQIIEAAFLFIHNEDDRESFLLKFAEIFRTLKPTAR